MEPDDFAKLPYDMQRRVLETYDQHIEFELSRRLIATLPADILSDQQFLDSLPDVAAHCFSHTTTVR